MGAPSAVLAPLQLRGEIGQSRLLPHRRHHVLLDHRQNGLTAHRAVVSGTLSINFSSDRVSRSDRLLDLFFKRGIQLGVDVAFVAGSVMRLGASRIAAGAMGTTGKVRIGRRDGP